MTKATNWTNPSKNATNWNGTSRNATNWTKASSNASDWQSDPVEFSLLLQNGYFILLQDSNHIGAQ